MSAKASNVEVSSDREIVITRIINAPRELVWEAWTDPKQVVHWWGPNGFTTTIEKMDVRAGGVWQHVMHGPDGTDYPNKSIFTEVVKPERISYSHGGGKKGVPVANFEATWTFEDLGGGKTRLTGRSVFPTAEARDFVVKTYGAIEGGNQTLARLDDYMATHSAVPTPDSEFVFTRLLDAPRDVVWKAWTKADALAQWWGPKGSKITVVKLEFRPGGTFHYAMQFPQGAPMWGLFVYREITPPGRIVWLNGFADAEGRVVRGPFSPLLPMQMLNTLTLTEAGGKTTVTIRSIAHEATAQEHAFFAGMRASMQQGYGGTMDQLAAYLAK